MIAIVLVFASTDPNATCFASNQIAAKPKTNAIADAASKLEIKAIAIASDQNALAPEATATAVIAITQVALAFAL